MKVKNFNTLPGLMLGPAISAESKGLRFSDDIEAYETMRPMEVKTPL